MRDRFWPVGLCFLLSGFAALIYQTAWTRQFAFVFGTSELAVATVLAAYMGGLALGSWFASRYVGRVSRPVLVYGLLEGGIALAALAVPFAIRASQAVFVAVLGGRPDLPPSGGTAQAAYFLLSSFAILLVPTALMGATLPLLARHVVHSAGQIGSRIGALYAINTAGAVAGTLAAAFWLLPAFGLAVTVGAAVAVNAVVLAIAVAVARRAPPVAVEADAAAAAAGPRRHWILPAILVSGAVSFTYEVLWFRLLSHLLGGSTQAFATMLASFLLGITLGSAVAARFARDPARAARGFGAVQIGIALLSVLAFVLLDSAPALANVLTHRLGRTASDVLVSVAILLPSTLCIGATFPFAVRVLARGPEEASAAAARVYAWNTVGAIVGSVGSGFWLLPAAGFSGTLAATTLTSATIALAAALFAAPRALALAAVAAGVLVATLFVRVAPPWRLLRVGPVTQAPHEGEIVFHAVGRSATVLLLDEGNQWGLRTNGLPESSIGSRYSLKMKYGSSRWLGALPSLVRPETRELLVIGLGGGVAIERVPDTVERLDVIELEPEVIEANRFVQSTRRFDPLSDARVTLHVNDARGALELTDRRWDAIASQPSHPWTAGASHLYTREFFRLAKSRLKPGGVLVQWMGAQFVDMELLRALLATILDTFPYVQVYTPYLAGEFVFVASDQPFDVPASAARTLAAAPALFSEIGLNRPEDVVAAMALDAEGARRFAAGAPVSTDDQNLLQTRSARVVLGGKGIQLVKETYLFGDDHAIFANARRIDPVELTRSAIAQSAYAAAGRMIEKLTDPAARVGALGLLEMATGRAASAGQKLDAALEKTPRQPSIRGALLRLRSAQVDRAPDALRALLPLDETEQTIVDAWAEARRAGDGALKAREEALARVPVSHPLGPDALRLRARWRIAAGSAEERKQALDLVDDALACGPRTTDVLLRARAALAAGQPSEAIASLGEMVAMIENDPDPSGRSLATELIAFLDALPDEARSGGVPAVRARLERYLSGRPGARPGGAGPAGAGR
jgi:spermidine synthase